MKEWNNSSVASGIKALGTSYLLYRSGMNCLKYLRKSGRTLASGDPFTRAQVYVFEADLWCGTRIERSLFLFLASGYLSWKLAWALPEYVKKALSRYSNTNKDRKSEITGC